MKHLILALSLCILFCVAAFSQKAEKIDEFTNLTCEEYLSRMDGAISAARNNPSATVYVLIYEGKEQRYNSRQKKFVPISPAYGLAKAQIKTIKEYLKRDKSLNERFSFVEAGFRENSTVEIWLVPAGRTPPEPTPTLKKMKYRKGKAKGFCTGCC